MSGTNLDKTDTVVDTTARSYTADANVAPLSDVEAPLLGETAIQESNREISDDNKEAGGVRLGNIVSTKDKHAYEQAVIYYSEEESETEDIFERRVLATLTSLFCASVVVCAQAAQDCTKPNISCDTWSAFAVALGFFSSFVSLVIFLIIMCSEDERNPPLIHMVLPYFSVGLVIWWTFGVATCTFDGPFDATGNGFLASWLALFISIYFCQLTISKVNMILATYKNIGNPQHLVMVMIMIMSFTEAFSSLMILDDRVAPETENAKLEEWLGLGFGIISGITILVVLVLEPKVSILTGQPGIVSYFLIPLWLAGAILLTFDEPFSSTGNGYFCVWGSFCGSCYLFYIAQTEKAGNIIKKLSRS